MSLRIARAQTEPREHTYRTTEILAGKLDHWRENKGELEKKNKEEARALLEMFPWLGHGDEDQARRMILDRYPELEVDQEASVWIKPFPLSKIPTYSDGIQWTEYLKRRFIHCIDRWDFLNEDDSPIPCTEEIKAEMFDYPRLPVSLVEWLNEKIREVNKEVSKIPKNS